LWGIFIGGSGSVNELMFDKSAAADLGRRVSADPSNARTKTAQRLFSPIPPCPPVSPPITASGILGPPLPPPATLARITFSHLNEMPIDRCG
jgi:hypothetical protein